MLDTQTKLWQLHLIKQTRLDVSQVGLLLCAPRADDPLYSVEQLSKARKSINGLRQEAARDELWLESVTDTEEAANLLISRIAAGSHCKIIGMVREAAIERAFHDLNAREPAADQQLLNAMHQQTKDALG